MAGAYPSEAASDEQGPVLDSLEAYVREGARRMLAAALEEEVAAFLGRGRYECVCQSGMAHFDHREWPTPGIVFRPCAEAGV